VENYIAIIVGALPGCSSYFKSYIKNSAFFTAISSRLSSLRSRTNETSKGSSLQNGYKMQAMGVDSESQRSLKYNAGQIGVKHSYDFHHELA
jgi:hypothetical protein